MICPKCKENNQISKVISIGGMNTVMGVQSYYDEMGAYHVHDCNAMKQLFDCSNGHRITIRKKHRCPSCDFNAGQDQMDVE